jgi:hypothetical protein
MEDPDKALEGGMVNRKRSGSNDVGWGIWPGNYQRFLSQVEPGSGDIGLWNIDESVYGRFGRRFDHASGKTRMKFKLDEEYFPDKKKKQSVRLNVTYLDKGTGVWTISYPDGRADPVTIRIQNSDTGEWSKRSYILSGLSAGSSGREVDFELNYESGDDTIFHMVEIERR